ncbi:MAG: hypothetical protein ACRD96_24870 [Bryobacteraceae bacterium]
MHPVRVAVVNQSFASFYFPNENAVGKSFNLPKRSIEIVGVVDLPSIALAQLALTARAIVAALVPALAAAKISPLLALQSE